MIPPILAAVIFLVAFSVLSNWASIRRERRANRMRQSNDLINQALYQPFGREWEEN